MAEQRAYYVYMMTNKTRTVLYTGMANNLLRRVWQHRSGEIEGFTARYNCNRLVHYEAFRGVENAIRREKQIKGWRRERKNSLVAEANLSWNDLSVSVLGLEAAPASSWHASDSSSS